MWFWRRLFFSFSVLIVSFGLELDLDSNLFGLSLDSDSIVLVLDSTKVDLTTALVENKDFLRWKWHEITIITRRWQQRINHWLRLPVQLPSFFFFFFTSCFWTYYQINIITNFSTLPHWSIKYSKCRQSQSHLSLKKKYIYFLKYFLDLI